jgi:hypothetical protein
MDIKSGCGYPASALSNFAPHPFVLDSVECNSMEGFLQSLKFKEIPIQIEVCKLVGYAAKKRGSNKNWQQYQILYWQGVPYQRQSKEYQDLLDRAYSALLLNISFRAAHDATLTHSIGRTKNNETVLTRREFCSRLMMLRDYISEELSNVFTAIFKI